MKSNVIRSVFDRFMKNFGYVRAATVKTTIVEVARDMTVEQALTYLENGRVIFPIQTDKNGRPIQFEQGVSYIVSSSGRWRKRRTPNGEASGRADAAQVERKKYKPSAEKRQSRLSYTGSSRDQAIYAHWQRLRHSCAAVSSGDAAKPAMVDAWKVYDNFAHDIGQHPDFGLFKRLKRINVELPYGPENLIFTDSTKDKRPIFGKFTTAEVLEIRNSPLKQAHLAKQYGVTPGVIKSIRTRDSYRHIP